MSSWASWAKKSPKQRMAAALNGIGALGRMGVETFDPSQLADKTMAVDLPTRIARGVNMDVTPLPMPMGPSAPPVITSTTTSAPTGPSYATGYTPSAEEYADILSRRGGEDEDAPYEVASGEATPASPTSALTTVEEARGAGIRTLSTPGGMLQSLLSNKLVLIGGAVAVWYFFLRSKD